MKVSERKNSPSFTHIKLSKEETKKVLKLYSAYDTNKSSAILNQVTDIFKPYIEKESKDKSGTKYFIEDLAQEYYTKLIEFFTSPHIKTDPISNIIKRLNNIHPGSKEAKQLPDHISMDNLKESEKEQLSYNLLAKSETPAGTIKELVNKAELTPKEKEILTETLDGDDFKTIAARYQNSITNIQHIYKNTIHKIKMMYNPQYRVDYYEAHPNEKKRMIYRKIRYYKAKHLAGLYRTK